MTDFAFISIGSNIDPEQNLPLAVKALSSLGELLGVSKAYQNPAVGPTPQTDYLNAGALLLTEHTAEEIRMGLRTIEADLGRVRTADRYAPRTIDIDLCILGRQVFETHHFQIPDMGILKHPHLAIPLAEVMPSFIHPALGASLGEIAERLLPDASLTLRDDVRLAPEEFSV